MTTEGDQPGEATDSPDLASEVSAWAERLAEKVQTTPEDDAAADVDESSAETTSDEQVDEVAVEAVTDDSNASAAPETVAEAEAVPETEAVADDSDASAALETVAGDEAAAETEAVTDDSDASAALETVAEAEAVPETEADHAGDGAVEAEDVPELDSTEVAEAEASEAEVGDVEQVALETPDGVTLVEDSDEADGEPGPDIASAIEAVLMVVDEPVPTVQFAQVLETPRVEVEATLRRLAEEYTEQGRGFDLREVAGGWRFYSRSECAQVVERFILDGQQARLTQAALETLAVIAYRQPVSRARVAAIRGVNCDGVVRTLVSRGLIEEAGHEEESNALLYRTTGLFLERLGLQSVDDLPEIAPYLPEVDDVNDVEGLAG